MADTPLPPDRETLTHTLQATGLPAAIVAHLTAQARPAVLMPTTAGDEDAIPAGASKLGGRPDLPQGMAWPLRPPYPDADRRAQYYNRKADDLLANPPSWARTKGVEWFSNEHRAKAQAVAKDFPLAFFGQFNLAELAQAPGFDPVFPTEGRLLVFYDYWIEPEEFTPEAAVGWRVIWDPSPVAELVRAPVPQALLAISNDEWSCVFPPAPVTTQHSVITPMPFNDKGWDAFPLEDNAEFTAYDAWFCAFGTPDEKNRDNHQFGGFPQPLQNGLQARSQLAANGLNCGGNIWHTAQAKALLESAAQWRLVVQIGADPHARFADVGAYYVMMREADIVARRFDQARVVYQCD